VLTLERDDRGAAAEVLRTRLVEKTNEVELAGRARGGLKTAFKAAGGQVLSVCEACVSRDTSVHGEGRLCSQSGGLLVLVEAVA
jgi:hypothetical protein